MPSPDTTARGLGLEPSLQSVRTKQRSTHLTIIRFLKLSIMRHQSLIVLGADYAVGVEDIIHCLI
jgi:hypothetical protein